MTSKSSFSQSLEIIFPEHCNHYGTLFGGQALQLLSKTAFVVAAVLALTTALPSALAACSFSVYQLPGASLNGFVVKYRLSCETQLPMWSKFRSPDTSNV